MSVNTDFKDRTIIEEINVKANTIDIVRTARVLASERLYSYAQKWEYIFLVMSIISTSLLVYSLIEASESKNSLIVSTIFSVYTLLVQNFIAKLNYNERALKFHYHQLDLENFLLELKYLLLNTEKDDKEKLAEHKIIMERYQLSLQGYENHSSLDHRKARRRFTKKYEDTPNGKRNWFVDKLKLADFSLDNLFVNVQSIVIFLFIVCYVYFFKGGKQ